ncbi:hypothetical protein GCM10022247_52130 [Allokutzneria multivorans]|uniref:Uncharacterized protein n=1 Tax=Allokutzneria multivorans TaxID=1142134 RepID=A0ABP7T5U4_9PSEU
MVIAVNLVGVQKTLGPVHPSVIELRQRFLPAREHCTVIGSSVTELSWLERVPRGRPALMIAEGLVPYLTRIVRFRF